MKALKIIGLIALILISIGAGLLWYASMKYEEVLKTVVLQELNARLKTEMKVEALAVSPFTELPFVSLNFSEVFIPGSPMKEASNDTLIYLKSLSLHFNVFDLWNEDFRARKLSLSRGLINIEVDAQGATNFDVIESKADSSSSPFLLKLESFQAENVRFLYWHKADGIFVKHEIHRLNSFGKISETELDAALTANFKSESTALNESSYLPSEELEAEFSFYLNFESKHFMLHPSKLQFSKSKLDLEGFWKPNSYDWAIRTSSIELASVHQKFPFSYLAFLESAQGKAALNLSLKKAEGKSDVQIDLSFNSSNMSYRLDPQFELTKLVLDGTFTNGNSQSKSTSTLLASLSSGSLNGNPFSANVQLQNFKSPQLSFEGKATIDFAQFAKWTSLDSLIQHPEGSLQLDLRGSGKYAKLENIEVKSILLQEMVGRLELKGIHFSADKLDVSGTNGVVQVHDQEMSYDLNGRLKEQEFEAKGELVGLIPWIYELSSRMKLETEFFLDGFNVDDLKSKTNNEIAFGVPDWIWLDAKVRMNSFEWNNLLASNLSFELQHRPKFSRLNKLQMSVAHGEMQANASLRAEGEFWKLNTQAAFSAIDVKELFFSFNQFGQSTLQDRHLEGNLNGSANLEFNFNESFEILPSSIFGESEFKIHDGRLIKFEALGAVADYFASNFILKRVFKVDELRKELQDIHFDTLSNTLLIRDQSVSLPEMRIKSSVLDLDLDGTYNFKNELDFHLDFYITDLMSRASTESEFGEIEEDGTGRKKVFLLMSGTINEPEFSMDKERKKVERKKKVELETKILMDLIKEEVKKGSQEALDLEEDFEIDWSPDEIDAEPAGERNTDSVPKHGPTEAEKQKGLKGFLNKLKQADTLKSDLEFDFEDDDL